MPIDTSLKFVPINIAILTISDTRTPDTDTSGALLQERINSAGHNCIEKKIIPDDVKLIRETLQILSNKKEIDCIITTGGTGLTGRDTTPEAVIEIADKTIEGFGELFRQKVVRWTTFSLNSRQVDDLFIKQPSGGRLFH